MKLEQTHIDHIKKAFANMQSKYDLLDLLNEVKPLVMGVNAKPFQIRQLTWYANPKLCKKRYTDFEIKKKSGSTRNIHAPVAGLKAIQKILSVILQCVYEPSSAAMGFVMNRSIVVNAKLHLGNRYVYNIDLKDFFPSIDQARVWKCLQLKPFSLSKETRKPIKWTTWEDFKKEYWQIEDPVPFIDLGGTLTTSMLMSNYDMISIYASKQIDKAKEMFVVFPSNFDEKVKKRAGNISVTLTNEIHSQNRLEIASLISYLCCTEMEVERKNEAGEWEKVKRNVLPQGAPTSPVITNIICQKLDYLLTGVAKRFGLKYSRYADDITFSSMHNVYQPEGEFIRELHRIIAEQGFHIKESKTRLQKEGYRKEVTGLLVNEKVNVQKRYIKQLRMWLYYWERYGYDRAAAYFAPQYMADKAHLKKGKPDMANVISGKLDYLKMVRGAEDGLYLKLKNRLDKLTGKISTESEKLIEIEEDSLRKTPLAKLVFVPTKKSSGLSNEKVAPDVKTEEKPIPVFHKPKELVVLLKNFSRNDSALKYTTHSWDAGRDANKFKDLSEFLLISRSEFNKLGKNLKGLNEFLYWKIYNFLFNPEIAKTGWGDINPKKRIYFGWSSPELLEACNNDISLNPEDFILPEKYQIQRSGKTLQKFKHIIDVFKNEIEVRDENSALLELILTKHDNYLTSFSAPKITNLENKTFYTDIQWLSKALDLIFEGIQKYPQHPLVEYAVSENNNDKLVFTILHRNSFKNGLTIHDDKLNLKRGDFSTIKDKLINLCDWSIESEFAEGPFRINYLVSDNKVTAYEKIQKAEGFKHILTFYK